MSKPRPGVQAGKRLFKCKDIKVWQLVEDQHDAHILDQVKTLKRVDKQYRALGKFLEGDGKEFITKKELLLAVKWKFLVGKARPALTALAREGRAQHLPETARCTRDQHDHRRPNGTTNRSERAVVCRLRPRQEDHVPVGIDDLGT